jgi:hypothetical protein
LPTFLSGTISSGGASVLESPVATKSRASEVVSFWAGPAPPARTFTWYGLVTFDPRKK